MTRATQRAALYATVNEILQYAANAVRHTRQTTRAEASSRRPVTRSMTTRPAVSNNSHPMTLRSSRR
jgi:hypothetical protein